MIKKIVIVVVCIVAITVVFGLQDRLTIEGFKHAETMLEPSITQLRLDVDMFSVIFRVVEVYDPASDHQSNLWWSLDGERRVLWFGDENLWDPSQPDNYGYILLETSSPIENIEYQPLWDMARKFTHSPVPEADDNPIIAFFYYFIMFFQYVVAFVSSLFGLLFDVFSLAFNSVQAALYLLGF